MKACNNCQLRGYSRELCAVHVRHCRSDEDAPPSSPSVRISVRLALGVAVGVFAALVVVTAASFVSGMSVFHTLLPVLVTAASLAGGACGIVQGIQEIRPHKRRTSAAPRTHEAHDKPHGRRRAAAIPIGVFFIDQHDHGTRAPRTRG